MNEGKRHQRLRSPPDAHAREQRREKFLDTYRSGTPAREIAAAFGMTARAVYQEAYRLRRAGLAASRYRERKNARPSPLASRTHPRVVTIVNMTNARAPLKEIGKALGGLSGERARQLREEIIALHGETIFRTPQKFLRQHEVAKELNVSMSTVHACAEAAGLLPADRKRGAYYRFTHHEVEAIRKLLPPRLGTGQCAVCARSFRRKHRRHVLCHFPSCRARWKKLCRATLLTTSPSAEKLIGWHRQLWEALKKHPIPLEETWMGAGAARALSGLSRMQLSWLALRGILTTRESSTRRWRTNGKPCREYARSQLLLAKRACEEALRCPRKDSP